LNLAFRRIRKARSTGTSDPQSPSVQEPVDFTTIGLARVRGENTWFGRCPAVIFR